MNDRRDFQCALARRGHELVRVRRFVAGALLAIIAFLTQVGPALACDAFDRPGEAGCPGLFYGAPDGRLDHEGGTGRVPDDCLSGPAYLAPDADGPNNYPRVVEHHDFVAYELGLTVVFDLYSAQSNDAGLTAIKAASGCTLPQGRYIYLQTLRVRL